MLTLAFKPYDTSSTIHKLLLFLQALEQNTEQVSGTFSPCPMFAQALV